MAETLRKPADVQPTNVPHYRCVLYLASIYALTQFIFAYFHNFAAPGQIPWVVAPLIILVGLFLHSNFIRYVGVAYYVLVVGSVIWAVLKTQVWNIALVWIVATGMLSLALIWFLLISKAFTREFSTLRNTETGLRKTLRNVMLGVLAGAVAVSTWSDILRLLPASWRPY